MKLTINGELVEVPDSLTIRGLLEHLGLTSGPVAVEQNLEVVPRASHEVTAVNDGDRTEVVHFVGGG